MNSGTLPWLWSFVMPALVVQWILLEALARVRPTWKSVRPFCATAILALAVVGCPVGDRSLARQLAGFSVHLSFPLLAVLLARSVTRCFGRTWLRPGEQRAIWWFGVAAGLLLYPSALGWSRFDSYGTGWAGQSLFWVVAVLSALALWYGNRAGVILLVSISAWHLGLVESRNHWDYLVDPIFFCVALLAVAQKRACQSCART